MRCCVLVISGLLLMLLAESEAAEVKVLHSLDVRWDQDGDHFTPITSDDFGTVYFAFVNADNNITIGKKAADQAVETLTVTPISQQPDQYHSIPSIAIDRDGYLHVFGPMHHTDMDYLKSNKPFEVKAGFTRQDAAAKGLWLGVDGWLGTEKHKWISYPYTFYDNFDNPWVSYRSRVGTAGWVPGEMSAQLARYDTKSGKWQALGGNTNAQYKGIPGDPNPKPPCFVWSRHSADSKTGYQGFASKPFIDYGGRLHYVLKHVRDTGSTSWSQEMLYFYSDDLGESWRLADGRRIADKPITVIADHPSVLWARGPTGYNDLYGGFPASSKGEAVVGYHSKTKGEAPHTMRFSIYHDGRWTEHDTGLSAFPGRLLIDSHDVWYLLAGREVHVSIDRGKTWKTHDIGIPGSGQNANFDVRYFKKTNKIRFVAAPSGGNGAKTIKIVEFVSDAWQPAAPSKLPRSPQGVRLRMEHGS